MAGLGRCPWCDELLPLPLERDTFGVCLGCTMPVVVDDNGVDWRRPTDDELTRIFTHPAYRSIRVQRARDR